MASRQLFAKNPRKIDQPLLSLESIAMATQPTSKNSQVAKSGFRAEDILCNSPHVLKCLGSQYFQKDITKCQKKNGHTKTDVIFTFQDGSQIRAQLKNGTGGGRGWSFDRRSVDAMPASQAAKDLLKVVCLKAAGERKSVPMEQELIRQLIFGQDDALKPEHFLHTTIENGQIVSLTICPASIFLEAILKGTYDTFNAKRTCVHLTDLIYLQRKGGGKADHSPDDIQAKLRCMPKCMTTIVLDQTMPAQQEQTTEAH
jgi:hypothetical protein